MFSKKRNIICLFMMIILACTGCKQSVNTESLLKERADTYWQHRIRKEFSKSYLMELPDFQKKTSLTDYLSVFNGKIIFLDAVIQSTEIEKDRATVKLKIAYAFSGIYTPKGGIPDELKDYWQRINGKWYHHFGKPSTQKSD